MLEDKIKYKYIVGGSLIFIPVAVWLTSVNIIEDLPTCTQNKVDFRSVTLNQFTINNIYGVENHNQIKYVDDVNYTEKSIAILKASKLTDKLTFKKEIYAFESNNNYTAVNNSNTCFGICQLNNYWGVTLLKRAKKQQLVDVNVTWEKQNTKPEIQDILCSLRFKDVDAKTRTFELYNNLTKYMAHQQGLRGAELIMQYIYGKRASLPNNVIRGVINNLAPSDIQEQFDNMQRGDLDLDYVIYKWLRRCAKYIS
jgi:hypothetical protein